MPIDTPILVLIFLLGIILGILSSYLFLRGPEEELLREVRFLLTQNTILKKILESIPPK